MIRHMKPAALVAGWIALAAAAHAAPPLEAYARLPGVGLTQLSPSGQRYAFVADVKGVRRVVAMTADAKPLFVSPVGEAKLCSLRWAGDRYLLITQSTTVAQPLDFEQSYEFASVLSVDVDKKSGTWVFESSRRVAKPVFGYFGSTQAADGSSGYFGGITYTRTGSGDYIYDNNRRFPDLYKVDLGTGQPTLAAAAELQNEWVVGPDGTVIAHSVYDQRSGEWRLYAGKNRDRKLWETQAPLATISLEGQGRSAGTVLVMDSTGDEDLILEVSTADGKREEILQHQQVQRLWHDPETGHLLGASLDGEPGAIFFDRRHQARFEGTRKAFPGLQVRLRSFSRDLERLIVETDAADDSGTFWLVTIATGKAEPIGYSFESIHPKDVGPTRWVSYLAADGLPIQGVLTLPPGREPKQLPLVVMPHGGPIGASDRLGFDWWAQAYAAHGYAVFQPNFRGSGGYGKQFVLAGYGEWGRKMQTDLSDGVGALAKLGLVDAKRVCIVGASYGGYAAVAGVTLQQGIYRCAVSVAGVANPRSFFNWKVRRHGYKSAATRFWRAATGADKLGDDAMEEISLLRHAARADAPVLLIHGDDDTVVPIEQSEDLASALKKAGKPVDFVVMKGEDHWLSRQAGRSVMLKAAMGFVQRHNPAD